MQNFKTTNEPQITPKATNGSNALLEPENLLLRHLTKPSNNYAMVPAGGAPPYPQPQPITPPILPPYVSNNPAYNIKIAIGNLIMIGKGQLHIPAEEHFTELINALHQYTGIASNSRKENLVRRLLSQITANEPNNYYHQEQYGEKYFSEIVNAYTRPMRGSQNPERHRPTRPNPIMGNRPTRPNPAMGEGRFSNSGE